MRRYKFLGHVSRHIHESEKPITHRIEEVLKKIWRKSRGGIPDTIPLLGCRFANQRLDATECVLGTY